MSYKQVGAFGLPTTSISNAVASAQKTLATARASAPAASMLAPTTAPSAANDGTPWYKKPTTLLIGGGLVLGLYFLTRK